MCSEKATGLGERHAAGADKTSVGAIELGPKPVSSKQVRQLKRLAVDFLSRIAGVALMPHYFTSRKRKLSAPMAPFVMYLFGSVSVTV